MFNLNGKVGLVVGIANDQSIAYGCARTFKMCGAEVAVTYLNEKAEKYVLENFVWTDNLELIAQKLQKISKTLNGKTESELAEKLLQQ